MRSSSCFRARPHPIWVRHDNEPIGVNATAALADNEAALAEWDALAGVPTLAITNTSFSAPIWYTKRPDDDPAFTSPSAWRDATNAVLAADDYDDESVGRMAVTSRWVRDGVLIESDLVLYKYYLDDYGVVVETEVVADAVPGSGQYDLLYTQVHEVGHAIGLEHSSYPESVMFDGQPNATEYPGLAPGDEAAAEWLYSG